jgi:hypothetical protein
MLLRCYEKSAFNPVKAILFRYWHDKAALRHLLRNKANFVILEGFIGELLRQDVTALNILESESDNIRYAYNYDTVDRANRIDVIVEDANGEPILVRIRTEVEYDYLYRMTYDVCSTIPYPINVRKIYAIHIVDFDLGQGDDYVYHGTTVFRGLHGYGADILQLSPEQRYVLEKEFNEELYSKYYIVKVNRFNNVVNNTLDEWMYFLKNRIIEHEFTAKGLDRAREALAYYNVEDEDYAGYNVFMDSRSRKMSMIASVRDRRCEDEQPIIDEQEAAIAAKREALIAERSAHAEKDAAIAEKYAAIAAERNAMAKKHEDKARALAELLAAVKKRRESDARRRWAGQ